MQHHRGPRPVTSVALAVAVATASACSGAPRDGGGATAAPTAAAHVPGGRHVFVISIDGLMPIAYTDPDAHQLKIPTLRELARNGAASPGVQSVFPSVTYPAHTTMVTGVAPGTHGITSNKTFDPLMKNQSGWFWYAEQIRVSTLWGVAFDAGLTTALINWPVTVGARATALVPEYWRAGTPDDVRLQRAISTPGLLDAVAERFPGFYDRMTPPDVVDSASGDIAVHLIDTLRPNLMLVHIWMVDEHQHNQGLWSPEAIEAIERADTEVGRIIDASKRAGIWDDTIIVVVSDHGFMSIDRAVRCGVVLREAKLVELGAGGAPTSWKAVTQTNGGACYVYLAPDTGEATERAVRSAFDAAAAVDGNGIASVLDRTAIRAKGGDPEAFLALDAATGFAFIDGYAGPLVLPAPSAATHGYDPDRPELKASLLVYGPAVTPGTIDGARLIDLAPTIAGWLGLGLPDAEGRPLPIDVDPDDG